MDYSQLSLHEDLAKGISQAGYVTCTPVQEQVLNVSLDGSDLYVQSQTGTGKTAAYLVTIMQEMLARSKEAGKKALIMVPTRELAVQVEEEAKRLGSCTKLVSASFYGGVGYEQQVAALKKGVDIIIGTPGRVIDLNEGRQMDLSHVGFLVIDEADRMFDMGFYPDLRKLIKVLPASEGRQTMLFSATLNSYVKNLAWEYTRDAKEITIAAENITVDEIDQELIHVSSDEKMRLLVGILTKEKPESVIIFCNTKRMCEVLSKRLKINGIESEFIIGDLPQAKRLKIMNSFKAGKISCLVATDVAARGIDVNDLAMVVNYDLPNESENYVHRIGRTARAGKSGKAYTFCSEQDVYSLVPIERYIEKSIPSRVAVESDFAEDKSKGIYIRTENYHEEYEDRDSAHGSYGSGRSGNRRGSEGRSRSSFGRDGDSHSRNDRRSVAGRTDGPRGERDAARKSEGRFGRTSRYEGERRNGRTFERDAVAAAKNAEDTQKLAKLSFDERMKLYKERYEHGKAPVNRSDERRTNERGDHRNDKNFRKNDSCRDDRRTARNNTSAKNQSSRAQNHPKAQNQRTNSSPKTAAPAKKKDLFGAIKALFGKKK
jgi:ATP-dependent RNA helicase RhlB